MPILSKTGHQITRYSPLVFQPASRQRPRPYVLPALGQEPEEWRVLDGFDWSREIIVDVGSGTGEWGLKETGKNPQKFFIAIERTEARSQKLFHDADELKLSNHLAIRADAVALVGHRFPKQSVSQFVFFYPNPTPKKRQANQRYFVSSSFQVFHDALKPGGTILLVSNVKAYVEEARYFLENFWDYTAAYFGDARFAQPGTVEKCPSTALPKKSQSSHSIKTQPRTAFERKYAFQGHKLFELEIQKFSGSSGSV